MKPGPFPISDQFASVMNPRRLLLTLLPVLMTAGAGVQLWHLYRPVPSGSSALLRTTLKHPPGSASSPVPMGSRKFAAASAAVPAYKPVSDVTGEIPPRHAPIPASPVAGPAHSQPISEQELQRRAARVEQEANHDLKHLVSLLDLNDSQQDRIFESLVRHAPGWHPAMQPVGVTNPSLAAGKTPNAFPSAAIDPATNSGIATAPTLLLDEIAAELTPDQQVELANSELDRQEWWEEVIPQLLADSETPILNVAAGTAAAAASPPPQDSPANSKTGQNPAVLAE